MGLSNPPSTMKNAVPRCIKVQLPGTIDPPCYYSIPISEIMTTASSTEPLDREPLLLLPAEEEASQSVCSNSSSTTSTATLCLNQLCKALALQQHGPQQKNLQDDYTLTYVDAEGDSIVLATTATMQQLWEDHEQSCVSGPLRLVLVPRQTTSAADKDQRRGNPPTAVPFGASPPTGMMKLCLVTENDSKCRRISVHQLVSEHNSEHGSLFSLDKLWRLARDLIPENEHGHHNNDNIDCVRSQWALVCMDRGTGHVRVLDSAVELDHVLRKQQHCTPRDRSGSSQLIQQQQQQGNKRDDHHRPGDVELKVYIQKRVYKTVQLIHGDCTLSNIPGNALVDPTTGSVSYEQLEQLVRSSFGWTDYEEVVGLELSSPCGATSRPIRNTHDVQNVLRSGPLDQDNVAVISCVQQAKSPAGRLAQRIWNTNRIRQGWALVLCLLLFMIPATLYRRNLFRSLESLSSSWLHSSTPSNSVTHRECTCECPLPDWITTLLRQANETRPTRTMTPTHPTPESSSQPQTQTHQAQPQEESDNLVPPTLQDHLVLSPLKATLRGMHCQVRMYPHPHVLFFHKTNRALWKLPPSLAPGRYIAKARVARKGPGRTVVHAGVVSLEDPENSGVYVEELTGLVVSKAGYYRNRLVPVELPATGGWDRFEWQTLALVDLAKDDDGIQQDELAFVVVAGNGTMSPNVDFQDIVLTRLPDNDDDNEAASYHWNRVRHNEL